jgi:hypothetical protein
MGSLAGLVGLVLGATACTETPSYFPPCVENSPCDTADAEPDATDAAIATPDASLDARAEAD